MANILLLVIVAGIAIALLALRTNALYVFFGLCAGNALVQFADRNMAYVNGHLNTSLVPHSLVTSQSTVQLAILLLPPILIAALAKHDNGPAKWPIQVFPAVATAILAVLFVTPLLSMSLQNSITQNKFWNLLEQYQVPVVGVCVLICIALLIMSTYSHGHGAKPHHKSK